jgi:hypothetical protein
MSLQSFIFDVVEKRDTVRTSGWMGYSGLSPHGYEHEWAMLSGLVIPHMFLCLKCIALQASPKRGVLGTHQGSVVPAHLQSSLEEFIFRFNRRNSGSRGLISCRLIGQSVATEPVTETEVTFGYDWKKRKRS